MTGRDVPTRQKTLSVAFSVIMVLSVIGMGMAGSAGAVVSQSEIGTTYDSNNEPGELEVLLINSSGGIQDSFSANTTSQTINRTNESTVDTKVGNLTASLNNTGKVIDFALNNATDTNSTVVVGPGEYNLTDSTPQDDQPEGQIEVSTASASSISVFATNTTSPNRTEINTTAGLNNLIKINDSDLDSLKIGNTSDEDPTNAGGIFFSTSGADAINVTNTADSFSLTFEDNNVSVSSGDGVVFDGDSTAPTVTVNSNTLTGVTSFVNITGVTDNATVSGSIVGSSATGLNFSDSTSNLTVDALNLEDLDDGINVTSADTSVDLTGVSTDNTTNGLVTATAGTFDVDVSETSSFNNDTTALDLSHAGNVSVDDTTTISDATTGVNLNSTGDVADVDATINNASDVGVTVDQAETDITLSSATFDGSDASTDLGLNFTTNAFASDLSIGPSSSFSSLEDAAIQLNNASASEVTIRNVTFEDSGDGVNITEEFSSNTTITNSTFRNVNTSINVDNVSATFNLTADFNSFTPMTADGTPVGDTVTGVLVDDGDASDVNLSFNEFVLSTESLNVTSTGSPVNGSFNWWGATNGPGGDFNGNGSSVNGSASDISINPATVQKKSGNVSFEQDFLGVVKDSQNVTLNGSSSDAEYNFSTDDSNTVPGANNNAEVDGTLVLGLNGTDYVFKDALNEGEVDTSVSGAEADSGKNGTSIANTTPTGDTPITVVGNNSTTAVDDTGSVTLVHEAVGLSEGFNLKSVPQPAKLYTQDVKSTNQWNSDGDTYESLSISQGGDVDSGTDLHRGLYVDAASSDARLGYSFATSEVPRPADVVMGNGWHLVGSNFDINSESGNRTLDVDLRNVENVTTDGSPGVTAYDSGLSGDIAGSTDINEYDTYWVYVDGEQTRVIIAPNYDPNGR